MRSRTASAHLRSSRAYARYTASTAGRSGWIRPRARRRAPMFRPIRGGEKRRELGEGLAGEQRGHCVSPDRLRAGHVARHLVQGRLDAAERRVRRLGEDPPDGAERGVAAVPGAGRFVRGALEGVGGGGLELVRDLAGARGGALELPSSAQAVAERRRAPPSSADSTAETSRSSRWRSRERERSRRSRRSGAMSSRPRVSSPVSRPGMVEIGITDGAAFPNPRSTSVRMYSSACASLRPREQIRLAQQDAPVDPGAAQPGQQRQIILGRWRRPPRSTRGRGRSAAARRMPKPWSA